MRASDLKKEKYCIYKYNQPNDWDTGCGRTYENWDTGLSYEHEYTLDIDICPFCNKPIKEPNPLHG